MERYAPLCTTKHQIASLSTTIQHLHTQPRTTPYRPTPRSPIQRDYSASIVISYNPVPDYLRTTPDPMALPCTPHHSVALRTTRYNLGLLQHSVSPITTTYHLAPLCTSQHFTEQRRISMRHLSSLRNTDTIVPARTTTPPLCNITVPSPSRNIHHHPESPCTKQHYSEHSSPPHTSQYQSSIPQFLVHHRYHSETIQTTHIKPYQPLNL